MRESMPSPLRGVRLHGRVRATCATVSVLLAVCAGATVPMPSERETWYELQTPHFVVVSNTRAGRVTELAGELERMVEAVGRAIHQPKSARERTLVVLLASEADFEDYCRMLTSRPCKGIAGMFHPGQLGPVILATAANYDAARATAFHELTHLLVRRTSPWVPLWLNEGLAEFYGTFRVVGDNVRIGQPIGHHLGTIARGGVPPLERLLVVGHDSPEYIREGDRERFYAGAWLLTHYLLIGNPARQGELSRYLAAVDRGEPADTAFWTALATTPAALEKELWAYAQASRMPVLRLAVGALVFGALADPRKLPYDETLVHLGELVATGNEAVAKAVAFAERARTANPQSAAAAAFRAWLLAREGRASEANALFEQALALDPDRARTHYLYADALLEQVAPRRAGATSVVSPDALVRARELLDRVLQLDPDHVRALVKLGRIYVLTPEEDCGTGIARLSRALALAPDNGEAAFYLAHLHSRAGFPARAEAVIARHIASSPDRVMREQATVLRTQVMVSQASRLMNEGKIEEALQLFERASASAGESGLEEYVQLELRRARAAVRMKALYDRIKFSTPAAALAACDEELAAATDLTLRAQIEALRESIRAAGQGPPGAPVPGDTTTTATTEIVDHGASQARRKALERQARSQMEADRYNEAVALHNKRDLAGALYIADDLAANATNQEVRTAASALAARIRNRYPNVLPSPPD